MQKQDDGYRDSINNSDNNKSIRLDDASQYNPPHSPDVPKDCPASNDLLKNNFFLDQFLSYVSAHPLPKTTIDNLIDENPIAEEILSMQVTAFIVEIKDRLTKRRIDNINESIKNFEKNISNNLRRKHHQSVSCFIKAEENNNYYTSYRLTLKDGDSFYRAFIYSYIEKHIVNLNSFEIKKIINDILSYDTKDRFRYRNTDYSKDETLYILSEINNILDKDKQYYEALLFFNKAFCVNDNFSGTLVKYLKLRISTYIEDHKKEFIIPDLVESELISYSFLKGDPKEFSAKEYNDQKIAIMNTEPDAFTLNICTFPFNCDEINIYYKDSFDPNEKVLNIKNSVLIKTRKRPPVTINLIYNTYKTYSIAYTDEDYKRLVPEGASNNNNMFTIYTDKNKKSYDTIMENKCNICKEDAKLINIDKLPNRQGFCSTCISETIDEILEQRMKYLKEDNYKYIEFYTRPIQFTKNYNRYILTDKNIKDITGLNIYEKILLMSKSCCDKCQCSFKAKDKQFTMPCLCKFCEDCFQSILIGQEKDKEGNEEDLYLNNFELEHFYDKNEFSCTCKKDYKKSDFRHLLQLSDKKICELIDKSEKRMIIYIRSYCMNCGEKQPELVDLLITNYGEKFGEDVDDRDLEEDKKISKNRQFFMVDIYWEKNNTDKGDKKIPCYCKYKHFICRDCMKKLAKMNPDNINENKPFKVKCLICNLKHEFYFDKSIGNDNYGCNTCLVY